MPFVPSGGSGVGGMPGIYGPGIDGAVTFDGVTTYPAFSTLLGSTYTCEIRDVFATAMTINPGITVIGAVRWYATVQMIINGSLNCNGANAAGATAGVGFTLTSPIGNGALGTAGGNGGTTTGTAGTGSGSASSVASGAGGAGGTGSGGAGGAGGTVAAQTLTSSLGVFPYSLFGAVQKDNSVLVYINGGAGGGGGGGDSTNSGGGGGGGGAFMVIATPTLSGTGVIQCRGGAGANGVAGNAAGGGGGGGGWITITGPSPPFQGTTQVVVGGVTVDCHGGAGGAGSGSGPAGTAGSPGTVFVVSNA